MEALGPESFADIDLALFCAGASVSRRFAPAAVLAGAIVVDNSSAFRMASDVPLVVPEVNAGAIVTHTGIVANPNCVAVIITVALAPLHSAQPILRIQAATYKAASGAGAVVDAETLHNGEELKVMAETRRIRDASMLIGVESFPDAQRGGGPGLRAGGTNPVGFLGPVRPDAVTVRGGGSTAEGRGAERGADRGAAAGDVRRALFLQE